MVILRGLKAAHRYRISVVAFTSKGAGPQSYWRYITTGTISFLMNELTRSPSELLRGFVSNHRK